MSQDPVLRELHVVSHAISTLGTWARRNRVHAPVLVCHDPGDPAPLVHALYNLTFSTRTQQESALCSVARLVWTPRTAQRVADVKPATSMGYTCDACDAAGASLYSVTDAAVFCKGCSGRAGSQQGHHTVGHLGPTQNELLALSRTNERPSCDICQVRCAIEPLSVANETPR